MVSPIGHVCTHRVDTWTRHQATRGHGGRSPQRHLRSPGASRPAPPESVSPSPPRPRPHPAPWSAVARQGSSVGELARRHPGEPWRACSCRADATGRPFWGRGRDRARSGTRVWGAATGSAAAASCGMRRPRAVGQRAGRVTGQHDVERGVGSGCFWTLHKGVVPSRRSVTLVHPSGSARWRASSARKTRGPCSSGSMPMISAV